MVAVVRAGDLIEDYVVVVSRLYNLLRDDFERLKELRERYEALKAEVDARTAGNRRGYIDQHPLVVEASDEELNAAFEAWHDLYEYLYGFVFAEFDLHDISERRKHNETDRFMRVHGE